MSHNKSAREELERRYGAECFIEKLHLRKDATPRKYTSKGQMKKMKSLTYHHIRERRKGGKATVENGALLSMENHQWFHKQSKAAQGYMNAMFQEYKRQVDESTECFIKFVDDLETDYEIKATDIVFDERGKLLSEEKKEKYNRAAKKREDRKLAEEYYKGEEIKL